MKLVSTSELCINGFVCGCLIDKMIQTLNRRRFVMKSCDELTADMEAIQQQMIEAKINERSMHVEKQSVCAKSLA